MDKALFSIVAKIKALRKEKGMTVQQLANETGYTKAFISKLENRRLVPSLTSLLSIIKCLGQSLDDFFKDIDHYEYFGDKKYIYLPHSEHKEIVREDSKGFSYKLVHSSDFSKLHVDVVLLELTVGSKRELAETDGFELFIVLTGQVQFQMDTDMVTLYEGDALYFDGRVPHKPINDYSGTSKCLVVYFLN